MGCVSNIKYKPKKEQPSLFLFFGGDAGFVANKVCVIAKRKCLHFKAER